MNKRQVFEVKVNEMIDMVSEMTIGEWRALRTEVMTKLEVENASEAVKQFFQYFFDNLVWNKESQEEGESI